MTFVGNTHQRCRAQQKMAVQFYRGRENSEGRCSWLQGLRTRKRNAFFVGQKKHTEATTTKEGRETTYKKQNIFGVESSFKNPPPNYIPALIPHP